MIEDFQITERDVFPNDKNAEPKDWEVRPTVKVIVENEEGEIAMITSDRHGLFLLPGGGAETKNLKKEAERECEEEINFDVEIKDIIATSVEFRNRKGKKYETTCFSAVTLSESPADTRTESEKENDLQIKWFSKEDLLHVINQQNEKLRKGKIDFYNIGFNVYRDKLFIEKYYSV